MPISVPQKKGEPLLFAQDEGIRAETSMETLAKLKPLIKGVPSLPAMRRNKTTPLRRV